ncbi:dihydropteroate synthase [Actinopolymorpha alba]|uniref:dihydropteroate synthase n=1 Tax=Actinopolymorpha alba TaxID=533267 RepID=UPI000372D5D5|nr:dihydropteroate synthase [Actinopolymorpha alba]
MVQHLDSAVVPSGRPRLVGIVNITTDSFSDGGRFLAAEDAIAHAWRLRAAGADIIELGPAASNPSAQRVTADEEIRRLADVIDELVAADIPVSVDSFLPETQRFAAARGASYLNDIQGFPDASRYRELADLGCRLIVMHSVQRRGPATEVLTAAETVWKGIEGFFRGRLAALQRAGVSRERLIIDPGLGYFLGRTPEPSLMALARIGALKSQLGLPVLVSPSRKSFLRSLTGRDLDNIGPASLAAELYAARQGVDFIRTHDVAAIRDALTIWDALGARPPVTRR